LYQFLSDALLNEETQFLEIDEHKFMKEFGAAYPIMALIQATSRFGLRLMKNRFDR
jgi:hypothetical protein